MVFSRTNKLPEREKNPCAIRALDDTVILATVVAKTEAKVRIKDYLGTIKNTDIVKELSLPPVKIHCSVLAEDAIKAAVTDWKKKQSNNAIPR